MRVAFVLREDHLQKPGGDIVQAKKTAESLSLQGCDISFITSFDDDTGFDLYHLFNLTRAYESFSWAKYLVLNEKKYVLSPIWHSLGDMSMFYGLGISRHLPMGLYLGLKDFVVGKGFSFSRFSLLFSWKCCVRFCVKNASMLLPNSEQEMNTLIFDLGVDKETLPYRVVPNAVSFSRVFSEVADDAIIVCAGRVEPRKNQLNVIKAFESIKRTKKNIILIILGAENNSHPVYLRKFHKAIKSSSGVKYMGAVSHEEVQRWFSRAKVSVLASHFETTGLVSLEAQFQGANLVMTNCSYNEFYFDGSADYCNPRSIKSIEKMLLSALDKSRNYACRKGNLSSKFSWTFVASKTFDSYLNVYNRI